MDYKTFMFFRILIGVFIAAIVAVSAAINNFYLAVASVLIGVLFMFLVKSKFKQITVDERVISVSGLASRITYTIVTVLLAVLGMFLIFSGRHSQDIFVEAVGTIFCYIAMFLVAIYAVSYHYFNKKYGANK